MQAVMVQGYHIISVSHIRVNGPIVVAIKIWGYYNRNLLRSDVVAKI